MLCTFCGTENSLDNKFCGMCGVRLERRQAERRGLQRNNSLKCPSCGHVNEPGQRFCGMCGSRIDRRALERRAASPDQPRATAMANAQLPTPEAPGGKPEAQLAAPASIAEAAPPSEIPVHPKPTPAIFRNEPPPAATISGPSFLGLGDGAENTGQYLLEDEGSSGSVLRKLVLIAILAAVGGLIFVQWRSGLRASPKTSAPAKPSAASASPQSANQTAAPAKTNAAPDASPSSSADAARADARNPQPEAGQTASSSAAPAEPADKSQEEDKNKALSAKPKNQEDSPSSLRRPSAALLRADQYLHGKGGVTQNCEQGLIYLRAAVKNNEPAAAVQMGALYATGHCVQQDRVMAYRWFNSAHELDPRNPWIQTNLDQLWARMTPQERRQAGP